MLGLQVRFAEPTTSPYFERFSAPVPRFEVDDVHAARAELETGRRRARRRRRVRLVLDGNLYALASRRR